MNKISILSRETIDKIAAGEVVERPSSIVKELVENAIDAGANAVTVEIRDGGTSLIRITDNGSGIRKEEVPVAFLRHATSKIRTVEDLQSARTLGFRGEALSSIAAIAQVELITKTAGSLTGTRYLIEGGAEKGLEEIGAPEGTTFLVRNMFYNTPARKKFLKSNTTEAGYISDLMERLALSHPDISFKFMNQGQTRMHTSGNCRLKDVIYGIYGRDITSNLLPVEADCGYFKITGLIGKPAVSRGNRNYENYFVNGRFVRSTVIARAIEEAYKPFMMNHRYPFTVLSLEMEGNHLDANVHPTKMEVRFSDQTYVYEQIYAAVKDTLAGKELIPEITLEKQAAKEKTGILKENPSVSVSFPEPFETRRREMIAESSPVYSVQNSSPSSAGRMQPSEGILKPVTGNVPDTTAAKQEVQMTLFDDRLLSAQNVKEHKLIGQVFDTYWIVEFRDKLFIIDQHAAHEKVMYERLIHQRNTGKQTSQMLSPPLILTLTMQEEQLLERFKTSFQENGFEIEPFGGHEYTVSAVPGNLYGLAEKDLFTEMLDSLADIPEHTTADIINDRIASMSCKAAVKGNHRLTTQEADALIGELLELENPYNCPHGRPTIISMTKYELEKKFKRIL